MNHEKFETQVRRLNPFDLTRTQSKRFQATMRQIGADESENIWDVVARFSDEQVQFVLNGAKGAANMPYRDDLSVECDNGYYKMLKHEGLAAPQKLTGDAYSASYLAEHDAYMVSRKQLRSSRL